MNSVCANRLPESIREARKCIRWLARDLHAQLSPAWSVHRLAKINLHRIAFTNYALTNNPLDVINELKLILKQLEDLNIPTPRDTYHEEINALIAVVRLLSVASN
jgi:hypothetical protein